MVHETQLQDTVSWMKNPCLRWNVEQWAEYLEANKEAYEKGQLGQDEFCYYLGKTLGVNAGRLPMAMLRAGLPMYLRSFYSQKLSARES